MPVGLPQEIFDIIIDHLDHRALRTCTLVSKIWLTRARYHLFSCVRLSSRPDLDDIRRWSSSPHLCQLVKCLIIGYGRPSATRLLNEYQSYLAAAFHDESLCGPFLEQISPLFPNVTSLNLDFVKFGTPLDAFKLVGSFSGLRQLQWKDVRFENLEQEVIPTATPPSSICDLWVTSGEAYTDIEPFIEWFMSYANRIRLETLVIGWSCEFAPCLPFLKTWASTLNTLDMSRVSTSLDCVDLGSMTSLQEIHLPFIHLRLMYDHDPQQWVYHILSSISSQRIHTIEIPLDVYYDIIDESESSDNEEEDPAGSLEKTMYQQLDRIDWRRIDQLLVRIQDRSTFLRVIVSVRLVDIDFPVAKRIMYKLLPNCFSQGLDIVIRLWRANDLKY